MLNRKKWASDQPALMPGTIHLVYDEFVVASGCTHRARVWLGRGRTPVALVQATYEACPSVFVSRKLAREVFARFIRPGMGDVGFSYFESWRVGWKSNLRVVCMERVDDGGVASFVNPQYKPFSWDSLEGIVGGPIDHPDH